MPRSSIVYSCRGREGATGSTTARSNHRGALMKNKIVTMTVMGALIMLRMIFIINKISKNNFVTFKVNIELHSRGYFPM